jgi:hypothetical protein
MSFDSCIFFSLSCCDYDDDVFVGPYRFRDEPTKLPTTYYRYYLLYLLLYCTFFRILRFFAVRTYVS